MSQSEYIEIHISGKKGTENLSPSNYDICELKEMIEVISGIMKHSTKSDEIISLNIEEGSVRQIYYSTKQNIAIASALFGLIINNPHLTDIDNKLATHIETIQSKAVTLGYTYDISTSQDNKTLTISPYTNYRRLSVQWVNADYYLYGIVMRAGGSTDGTISLKTKDELLNIEVDKKMLEELDKNIVYHECGMYVKGRQNALTYEMDKSSLKLVEFLDYTSRYDKEYLKTCIERATPAWAGIKDPAEWLHQIRGDYGD